MLGVTYVVLACIAATSGVIEAFLVPLRLPHGIEGLSVALAFLGNLMIGALGGFGTKTVAGAIVPAAAWFLTLGFVSVYRAHDDVILPGKLPVDPGVTKVSAAFFLLGILASAIAVALTLRYTRRADQPTSVV